MDQARVMAELTAIFHDVFGDEAIVLTPATTADDIPEWDSFNHVNLLVATERHFGIKFRTAEVEGLRDVGELAAAVVRKTS